jgi:HK97 family phage portal protein
MNIISRTIKSVGALLGNVKQKAVGAWASFGFGSPATNNRAYLDNNKNWVYVCVHRIALTMAGTNFRLMKYDKAGKDTEVFDHAALKLLQQPNAFQTQRELIYMLVAHQELTGNAYLKKDTELNPTKIVPLMPDKVTVVVNSDQTDIDGYKFSQGKTITPKEIIHLKYPSVDNPFVGSGVLSGIVEWVDSDNLLTGFNRSLFKNGARLTGILETNATTQDKLDLARVSFEEKYMGAGNSFKVAALPKDWSFKTDGLTPVDVSYTEQDLNNRNKILSAFGVPKSVLGITEDVNRANAEASNYVFMMFTIKPKLDALCDYLNERFLPSFKGTENMYFTYDNVVPENQDYDLRHHQTALAGQSWETINEARAAYGLAPIENGDSVLGSFAVIPVGQVKPETAPAKAVEVKQKMTSRIAFAKKKDAGVERIADVISKAVTTKQENDDAAEVVHKAFITRITKFENLFKKELVAHDETLKEEAIKKLQESKSVKMAVDNLVDNQKAVTMFINFASPILQQIIKTEGKAQIERINTTNPYNPLSPSIQERMQKLLALTAQSYTDTTVKLLQKQLAEATANGESLEQITNRVSDVFGLASAYRAEQVARTSVFGIANATARDAYKQSGVVKTVVWHTASDEKVCEFCGPLDGKTVDVDEDFLSNGQTLNGADGGKLIVTDFSAGDPPVHASCRCFTNVGTVTVENSVVDEETKELQDVLAALESDNENHE